MFISSTTFLCLYVFAFCWVNLLLISRQYGVSFGHAVAESPVSGCLIVYTFVTATSTEPSFTPGGEPPLVPVPYPGASIRD